MNPLMLTFVILGVVYGLIGVWALIFGFSTSLGISVAGMVICFLGWKYTERYLQ